MNKFSILIIAFMVALTACSDGTSNGDSSNSNVTNLYVVSSLTIERDNTADVISLITPTNAVNQTLHYSSSDEKIATVDDNGTVTGVAYGRAIITVTSDDNPNIKRAVYINVNNPVDTRCDTSTQGYAIDENGIWVIFKESGLKAFRDNVTIHHNVNINGRLACDIELDKNTSWVSIGYTDSAFNGDDFRYEGIFDGDNYTISGLYIYANDRSDVYSGLFDVIGDGGIVKNLIIKEPFITNVNQASACGAVAGRNYGTIDNVSSIGGSVSGSSENSWTGGIVGNNFGTITFSSNSNKVKGVQVGGIAASNDAEIGAGLITASYNFGELEATNTAFDFGGIVGVNTGTVTASYNIGSINGDGNVGGIVSGNSINNDTLLGTINACYNIGQLYFNGTNVGGIARTNGAGTITSSYYLASSASKGISDETDTVGKTEAVDSIAHFRLNSVLDELNTALENTNYMYVRNEFEDATTRPLRVIAK